jgi:hypothetical protein
MFNQDLHRFAGSSDEGSESSHRFNQPENRNGSHDDLVRKENTTRAKTIKSLSPKKRRNVIATDNYRSMGHDRRDRTEKSDVNLQNYDQGDDSDGSNRKRPSGGATNNANNAHHAHDVDSLEDESIASHTSKVPSGMASAMLSILSTVPPNELTAVKGTKQAKHHLPVQHTSVVLSRARTRLQRLFEDEKQDQIRKKSLKRLHPAEVGPHKRVLRAYHVPLSAATISSLPPSISVTDELNDERMFRRIATRGVVALFNAIEQHQSALHPPGLEQHGKSGDDARATRVRTLSSGGTAGTKHTKHSFLDLIKSTVAQKSTSL